ncbi:MAG: FkbM family methyltransferase [Dehalococcoidia bacterium]|nr:FkbM family methyltransferase [Dehalococcoidia bacterium]
MRFHLVTGLWERNTVAVVKRLLKPGWTVLDIGAHVGYYSTLFAGIVGETGRVFAFEPHPKTYETLCQNVVRFNNIVLVQKSVTDKEGKATLYSPALYSGSSSLSNAYAQSIEESYVSGGPSVQHVDAYTVDTVAMDSFLEDAGVSRVDFIKLDVEGTEVSALRGMRNTLSSEKLALVVEFSPIALRAAAIDPRELWDFLRGHGFDIMCIEKSGTLTPLMDIDLVSQLAERLTTERDFRNLLCLKGYEPKYLIGGDEEKGNDRVAW